MIMPTLTPPLSPARQWLSNRRRSYELLAGWYEGIASELDKGYSEFWQMADSDINEAFAILGIEASQLVFAMHAMCVESTNAALSVLRGDGHATRGNCIAGRPREIVVNAAGNIELVPLPPAPEPPPVISDPSTGPDIDPVHFFPFDIPSDTPTE